MLQGIGKTAISEVQQGKGVSTPINTGGAGQGGYLAQEADAKESSTAAKFGDIYKQFQAKYGEKPQKAREIKKTLGKDDFLRIMLTQMKNQDPTNPFKTEQMATEMAQFTSVEQLSNVNQNLAKMSNQNKPLEQMAMSNMIGKTVTIDRERFPHLEGESESLNFNLPKDAATVHISIVSDGGEVVLEKDIGSQKAGEVSFPWDGVKSNTIMAKGGNYLFRVDAKDERGRVVETNPRTLAKVIGVSFEGADPVFLVGDANHYDKVTMRNIVRIEEDGVQRSPAKANVSPSGGAKGPSFFEFKRGEGSRTIDANPAPVPAPAGVSPGAVALVPPNLPQGLAQVPEEKGFPNGIHELDSSSQIQIPSPGKGADLAQKVEMKGGDLR